MTWNVGITDSIVAALHPDLSYSLNDIRRAMQGHGISDVQLRNAVYGLHTTGRLLQSGRRLRFRYRINPAPPIAHRVAQQATAAALCDTHADATLRGMAAEVPAIAPAWPAPRATFRTFGRPMVAALEASPC